MGAVYLARQSRPRRTVAVKVLMPSAFLEQKPREDFLVRFRREADAIAALDHVNIMPVYEYGEQGNLAYLVMPYVTGGTLRQVLEDRGALTENEVVPIIEQAAAALDAAHKQGIIHRDLKPGNILFHADGRVLLADFGLAKMIKDAREFDSQGQGPATLTNAGAIIGTPEYLSPEQGTGKLVDYRTDVYSLGVVLFQMLSGRVPFTGSSTVAIAIKHALEEPPSLTQINPVIKPEVDVVVRKALAKNPNERYSSAGELAQALRAAISGSAIAPPTTTAPSKKAGNLESPDTEPVFSPGLHSSPTEAGPSVVPPTAPPPTIVERAPEERLEQVRLADEVKMPYPPVQDYQTPKRAGRVQSVKMMLLGSLLTLLIIVGSLVTYLHFHPTPGPNPQPTPKGTPQSTATAHGSAQPTVTPLPQAAVPAAGALIYGTPSPGKDCDKLGGKWSSTSNSQLVCNPAGGIQLTNNGGSGFAAVLLNQLPKGQQFPNDYIIQVQVDISASHGNIAILFRNQLANPQNTFEFIVNPAGSQWQFVSYDPAYDSRAQGSLYPANPTGTITIDVQIQGDDFNLYINGGQQGNANSGYYQGGTIGLAAEKGSSIAFKNLEVYALK